MTDPFATPNPCRFHLGMRGDMSENHTRKQRVVRLVAPNFGVVAFASCFCAVASGLISYNSVVGIIHTPLVFSKSRAPPPSPPPPSPLFLSGYAWFCSRYSS